MYAIFYYTSVLTYRADDGGQKNQSLYADCECDKQTVVLFTNSCYLIRGPNPK